MRNNKTASLFPKKLVIESLKQSFTKRIYNRLLLNILYVINQKYGLNL